MISHQTLAHLSLFLNINLNVLFINVQYSILILLALQAIFLVYTNLVCLYVYLCRGALMHRYLTNLLTCM